MFYRIDLDPASALTVDSGLPFMHQWVEKFKLHTFNMDGFSGTHVLRVVSLNWRATILK